MRHITPFLVVACWAMPAAARAATVGIVAPADGSTVWGTVPVTIQVSPGYTSAAIYVDGRLIGSVSPDTTPASTLDLDTIPLTDGTHTILCVAFALDENGSRLLGFHTVQVNVSNAAQVTIVTPAEGAAVSGTVAVTVHSPGYTSAAIYVDGRSIGAVSPGTTPASTLGLDTIPLTNGTHTILCAAFALDENGSRFLGFDTVEVNVNNAATVTIVTPAEGATVSGTVPVTIQVSPGYASAAIYVDGGLVGSVSAGTTPPHTLELDTVPLANGGRTIRAEAFGPAGTFLGFDARRITVSNIRPPVVLDRYGGRADVACAGGVKAHFYREKIGNRWWLCTPLGHGFISISAYAVSWTGLAPGVLERKYATGGPAANDDPASNWAYRMAQRYGSWGFNSYADYTETGSAGHILPWVVNSAAWPAGDHTIPIKMPYVTIHPTSSASQRNLGGYAPAPAKGWRIGLKHVLDLPDFYPPYVEGVDYFDPNWSAYADASLERDPYYTSQRAVNSDWLLGVSFDDMDFLKFAGPGDAFPTVVHGQREVGQAHHTPHWGLLTLIASPVHAVDTAAFNGQLAWQFPYVMYEDEVFHAKRSFITWLQQTANQGPGYAGIEALNASWGLGGCGNGGYCSFASQAVAHTEALCPGAWDGVEYRCVQTLGSPPTPLTLRIKRDGQLIGGDDGSGYHQAPPAPSGRLWGPGLDSGFDSVNYATGAVSITFAQSRTFGYEEPVSGTEVPDRTLPDTPVAAGMVTVQVEGLYYCQDDGLGRLVTYTGTGMTHRDPYTCTGAIDYATGAITDMVLTPALNGKYVNVNYATPTPPPAGSPPTIDYKTAGWGVGAGVADEDGTCPARGSRPCWMPAASWTLAGINGNLKRDLDNFLQYYAATAFAGEKAAVNRHIPGALLFCNSGSYATPAHAPVLRAMGQHCDVALDSSAFAQAGVDDTDMLARYNYFIAHAGDVPIGSWEGFGANPDSHLNMPDHLSASPPVRDTQAERAATYTAMLDAALNTRDATYDSYHFVAWKWWALVDTPHEQYNWGLIDELDNAYDGHEASTGTVACSPPVETYTCGNDNGDWGDFLGPVTGANNNWLYLPAN